MYKLSYENTNNIPVFKCDYCGSCSGILESTCHVKGKIRGCCWYFPKYNLIDIKNILDGGHKSFIYKLLNMKNAHINKYCIDVNGEFHEEDYLKYKRETMEEDYDFDSKLFYKICPFNTQKGCNLDFNLRPHPCNLYLCREIIKLSGDEYNKYSKERKDYFAYCNYYDELLKDHLIENKINLTTSPYECIDLIEGIDIPKFEYRTLESIDFTSGDDILAG
ncbi:hypothetical protein GCM10008905_32690 [Clostridium malenominatum]|uniref:Flagellin N-methylase n=1 Tax=Clostridium malenominatum TaxID=1539 RepID=A0ABN1J7A1_9CLOT